MDDYRQAYAWISFGLGLGLACLSLGVLFKSPLVGRLMTGAALALREPDLPTAMVSAAILASVAITAALGGFVMGAASRRGWGFLGSLLCLVCGGLWLLIFVGAGL